MRPRLLRHLASRSHTPNASVHCALRLFQFSLTGSPNLEYLAKFRAARAAAWGAAWGRGGGGGGGGGAVCTYISREGAKPICLTMCELVAKVARIMRECAVPMTPARIRYVRLHCKVRHLERRTCARRCDVRLQYSWRTGSITGPPILARQPVGCCITSGCWRWT